MEIKEGDPIEFHWAMDDSSLLTVSVELPSLQQTFSSRRFYVDRAGHHSFEGDAGEKLVDTTIGVAEAESAEVVKAVGAGAKQELDDFERKLEEQRRRLGEASSGGTSDKSRTLPLDRHHGPTSDTAFSTSHAVLKAKHLIPRSEAQPRPEGWREQRPLRARQAQRPNSWTICSLDSSR
jgi:hypothetical protein